MARLPRILSICVLALIFSVPTLADQVTLFTQPLADFGQPIESFNVPTTLDVGLALCLACSLNPVVGGMDIGPFGPITAQPVSETFTVGPSNPAFAAIVQALQGPPPTHPPFFEFVPFVEAFDANGNSEFLQNGYGVGTVRVSPNGTIQSLSIVVPEISKFEFIPSADIWVAVGPDGKQVNVSWVAQGVNIAAEPSAFVLLVCEMGLVAGWLALGKLRS
jgi:hypothetical protein